MHWTKTPHFRAICRLLVLLLILDTARAGQVALPFQIRLAFGPGPALAQDELLQPTPDADAADPFITAKAAELGGDPAQIFAFVRDEVGFESYVGSLRGARGTLWSKAGNALDRASLLVALLRASNVRARYVAGTLTDDLARRLVLSMFPAPARVVGCLEPGADTADPGNDPVLLAEARQHYWAQLDAGSGFRDADPSFAEAEIGDTFAATEDTFAEVPDALRHRVTLRLQREMTLPLAGILGAPSQDVASVLEETFVTPALVGKPLTVGHFVDQTVLGAVFTSVTNVYSPYIRVGDLAVDPDLDLLITGEHYQEVLTNFPFGSEILTGVFLEVDLSGPDGATETHRRALLDRIGVDIRANGGTPSLVFEADGPPALLDLDLFTLNVLPARQDPLAIDQMTGHLRKISERLTDLPEDGSQPALAIPPLRDGLITLGRVQAAGFFMVSDEQTERLARSSLVRSYFDQPRLTLTSLRTSIAGDPPDLVLTSEIDLRRDGVRAIAYPGQSASAPRAFNATRGVVENVIEREVFSRFLIDTDQPGPRLNTASIFESALAAGAGVSVLTSATVSRLDALAVSAEAKARIAATLARPDRAVVLPEQTVDVDGVATTAWYEVDLSSGEVIGVTENGAHSLLAQNAFGYLIALGFIIAALSFVLAFVVPKVIEFFKFVENCINCFSGQISGGDGNSPACQAAPNCRAYQPPPPPTPAGPQSVARGAAGVRAERHAAHAAAAAERAAVLPPLGFDLSLVTDESLGGALEELLGVRPVTGGARRAAILLQPESGASFGELEGSGVAAEIVPDPQLELVHGGALLPTVFRVGIRNLGAADDTFALDVTDVPSGFTAQTSVASITVPAGETVEVGVCLRPTAGLPPPGTDASFALDVTSTGNAAITTSEQGSFVVPEVHGVSVTSSPRAVATTPGAGVDATLSVSAVGNVAEEVSLDAVLPADLSLAGLHPVSLGAGESASLPITLTAAAGTPLNTRLTARIEASFGAAEPSSLAIPVDVVVPGAEAVVAAAAAARSLGDGQLASRLNDLGVALTNLVQDPTSDVFKAQALANLDGIIALLAGDPDFTAFVADLVAARDALAQAASSDAVVAAVDALGAALEPFAGFIADLARHDFDLTLLPTSAVAQPQTPIPFQLALVNTGDETSTYGFAVEGLPPDVQASFSQTSLTLAPGAAAPSITQQAVLLTLTPTSQAELQPFGFLVRVTVQQAPEVQRTVAGSLSVRNEHVSVLDVTPTPAFTDPGGQVQVSARLLNAVNRARQALASYVVRDTSGNAVFASTPVQVSLTLLASLQTVDLGPLDTTGFALGTHTIEVALTDLGGVGIPGAVGSGTLLVGSPVTASIATAPDVLPPGTSTVTTTLEVGTASAALEPLEIAGQTAIAGAHFITVLGDAAYVGVPGAVQVVDVSDRANPVVVGTIGQGVFPSGVNIATALWDDKLVVRTSDSNSGAIWLYSLADPLAPVFESSGPLPYRFTGVPFVVNDAVYVHSLWYFYNVFSLQIFEQHGDVFALDLTAPGGPSLIGALFTEPPAGQPNGGDFHVWQLEPVAPDTLYAGSTTTTGTNTQSGSGRVLIADVSEGDPDLVGELAIPGTVHVIAIKKYAPDRMLVAGSSGGWGNGTSGLTGQIVLTTLDVSDPRAPQIVPGSQQTIAYGTRNHGFLAHLGGSRFALPTLGAASEAPAILLIDNAVPGAAEVLVFPVSDTPNDGPANVINVVGDGQYLYAVSTANGLVIYDLGGGASTPATVEVEVPKATGVEVVPGSFNVAPDLVLSFPDSDTLVWNLDLTSVPRVLSFESTVSGLAPGETREVTLGTRVDFTSGGTPGEVLLAATQVASEPILGLEPATRTVRPGEIASYALGVENPTAQAVQYDLAVQGVPAGWAQLAPSVELGPGETADVSLVLGAAALAPLGRYDFTVTAAGDNGAAGSVVGTLVLEGAPVRADARARGVVVSLRPASASAGRGTSAFYSVRVTNVGSESDGFVLDLPDLAPGIDGSFGSSVLDVPPGAGNFRETTLALTPQAAAATGSVPFTVRATAVSADEPSGSASGELEVLTQGVDVAIDPPSGPPGTTFMLTVTNTGTGADTFDLSVAGPLAASATLASSSVTLAPGAAQAVGITLGMLDLALPGTVSLVGVAASRANPAVADNATALVTVGERKGVDAMFEPDAAELPAPGDVELMLNVLNFGNVEDSYSATIVGTSGPVAAEMTGLDGAPTQIIEQFALPGLANGAVPLTATLAAPGAGSVTVRVQSLSDATVFVDATAQVRTEGGATPTPSATPTPTATPGPTTSVTPLDPSKCYVVRTKTGTPQLPQIPGVELTDEFETIVADVVREKRLCNPVAVDGVAPRDAAPNVACYALRPAPGQDLVVPENASIVNRFGEQTVRFLGNSNERTLCVPAEAHLAAARAAEQTEELQSFRCRRVRGVPSAALRPAPEVELEDELEAKHMRVRRIHSLCAPVARGDDEVRDPSAYLACYQLAQVPGQPAFRPPGTIELASEIGEQSVIVRNAQRMLCVPTRRAGPR